MLCPVCPTVGIAGGWIGSYFGNPMPVRSDHRMISAVLTSAMIGVTIIALKYLVGVSPCDGNGNFTLRNIAQVGAISLLLGIVYSIGVNFLIKVLSTPPAIEKSCPDCCCSTKTNKEI